MKKIKKQVIQHARAAQVPLVVAVNKCDLEAANPQRVLDELALHGTRMFLCMSTYVTCIDVYMYAHTHTHARARTHIHTHTYTHTHTHTHTLAGVVVEELGGDVQSVNISALTGLNIDLLEEAVALLASIMVSLSLSLSLCLSLSLSLSLSLARSLPPSLPPSLLPCLMQPAGTSMHWFHAPYAP